MLADGMTLPRLGECVGATQGLLTFQLPNNRGDSSDPKVTICLADRHSERNGAIKLVNRRYLSRGYGSAHQLPTNEHSATFTVLARNSLIGTLSLTVDCPAGLASDVTFGDELDKFRRDGAKICELTKLAFESAHISMRLLASLFHTILIYGTNKYDCTDLFIEVNPRHRRFYETMLNFKRVGQPRVNRTVGAPSHLLWLKVSAIRHEIDNYKHKTRTSSVGHSLYPLFFSKEEEAEVRARLLASSRHHYA